jgi:hypothetical protein
MLSQLTLTNLLNREVMCDMRDTSGTTSVKLAYWH